MIGSGSVAHKGSFLTALSVNSGKETSWIVDSGASDHMTGNAKILFNYTPSNENFSVRIADGSLSKVLGTGSIRISEELTLHSVLFVPSLDCNLLSISKLTHDLNCTAKFFHNFCEFQDSDSWRTIGSARLNSGLYLLKQVESKKPSHSGNTSTVTSLNVVRNNKCAIQLWHYRLGHLNFVSLKKLFLDLFINKNPRDFQCEICHLSKQPKQNFQSQTYKMSKPFSMIHSDVWGPFRIKNISGDRWFVSFIGDHTRLT